MNSPLQTSLGSSCGSWDPKVRAQFVWIINGYEEYNKANEGRNPAAGYPGVAALPIGSRVAVRFELEVVVME